MTNQVLIRDGAGEVKEYVNVLYCEQALRARDEIPGIAIQYQSDDTDFIAHGDILGVYPEESEREFTHKYEELVN